MSETITIPHNGIAWNVEVLPFDNGNWEGGVFITEVTSELIDDTPDLLDQWTRAIEGHILSHRPAEYGWRHRPELVHESDFERMTDNWHLRCRAIWSKRQGDVASLIVLGRVNMTLGQMIDAQRGSLGHG
jgi:hypothetical protein